MRRVVACIWAVGILAGATAALAGVPPPDKRVKPEAPPMKGAIQILPVEKGRAPRLEVPKLILNNAHASAPDAAPFRTVIAGVLLSLSLIGGGLWVSRRQTGPGTMAVVLGALAIGAAAGVAWGNAAPWPRKQAQTVVEVRAINGSTMILRLSPDQFDSLVNGYNTAARADSAPDTSLKAPILQSK